MTRTLPTRYQVVGRGLLGGGSQLLNVGAEAVNRALGLPGLVANLSGLESRKRLRVRAVILSAPAEGEAGPADGRPLASEEKVRDALREADEIFTTGNALKVQPVIRFEDREMQFGPLGMRARKLYWEFAHAA